MKKAFDLIVVGAGSAGRHAAQAAGRAGHRVGLVEYGPFGGLCILKGCMPTKAMLRSSEIIGILKKAPEVGVLPGRWVGIDFPHIMRRKDKIIGEMAEYALASIQSNKNITLLSGRGTFLSSEEIRVDGTSYRAPKFVIATGSCERILRVDGLKETGYMVSDHLLEIKKLPDTMVVIGGGAEAVEFGQFLARLGVRTTLLQRSDRILSKEDPDVSKAMAEYLVKDGIRLYTGVRLLRVGRQRGKKVLTFLHEGKQKQVSTMEILLVAGRTGNIEGLDLDRAGVRTNESGVMVDDYLQTTNPNIYAAGDVTGVLQVVNMATYQGEVAGRNALSEKKAKIDYRVIPRALFTDPEFARVGLSEQEAKSIGKPFRVGSYPFNDLGKAIVSDRTEGFIKIIADSYSAEILGVAILGPEASVIIHQAVVAMHFRATLSDYAKISHIHPSLAEIILYLVEEMVENPSP